MTTTSPPVRLSASVAAATALAVLLALISPQQSQAAAQAAAPSASTPVSAAETPAYAVAVGQAPAFPSTIKVNTAGGTVADAPVAWDLEGMSFAKPYASYTIYGTVPGLAGYVTASVETLAPGTVYYIDSGAADLGSAAFTGAKSLLGAALRNDVSDQAKSDSTSWGYSGQDGVVADAGPKDVNGLYGPNGAGNSIDYALTLAPGTYTAAFGIHEWWGAGDRQVGASLVDSQGSTTPIVQSTAGAINAGTRSASLAGSFTVPADGGGAVKLRLTNVGWQGASVTWLGVAQGAQTLDLSPDVVAAPTISPGSATVYGTAQQITLAAASGALIYYTTDGSAPSRVNGTRYTAPFPLSASATVRAVAIGNGVPSPITSSDYTIVVHNGAYTSVPVGQPWFDTAGNSIQAHGGGFLEHDGWYYWVGEDKAHNAATFNGVNLYRSKDLLNWTFVGQILKPEAAGLDCNVKGAATCKVERPKLLYNAATKTFVLWGHWEDETSYSPSQVVVATSKTIDGDYGVLYHARPGAGEVWSIDQEEAIDATVTAGTYPDHAAAEAAYRAAGNTPEGHQSRDFTVYVDAKGKGWLISAEADKQLRIYPLDSTYTKPDVAASYPLFAGEAREAAAITQVNGVYYLVTSGQSGWYANQLKYAYTTDLSKPDGWSKNINLGNNTTFKSQATFLVQLQKADGGSSVVYMGDRWVPNALSTSTYVWLPVKIDSATHGVTLDYTDTWSLNTTTGETVSTSPALVSQGKPASATPAGSLSAGYTDGVADPGEVAGLSPASAANDGVLSTTNRYDNSHYFYPGDSGRYSWQVDLGAPYDLARTDISWRSFNGSETYSGYVLSGSNDGSTWSTILDRTYNRTVGFTSDHVSGTYRYVRVSVTGVVNDHNGNNAGWASGLVEVQVYGSPLPASVAVAGGTTIDPGATAKLTATVAPAAAEQGVAWSSSDPRVATVDADGTVHGVSGGTVTITATSTRDAAVAGTASVTVREVRSDDGAKSKPGTGVLSSNQCWPTGLRDGDFQVTMTLARGENGSLFKLYRDGVLVGSVPLKMASPKAQKASVDISGLRNGTYKFTGVLVNSKGSTPTTSLTVKVTDANPGKPFLFSDNRDRNGAYTVTATMLYGTNATSYRFLENGVVVKTGTLTARSPLPQVVKLAVAGKAKGGYVYKVEFTNAAGTTVSAPLTVSVSR